MTRLNSEPGEAAVLAPEDIIRQSVSDDGETLDVEKLRSHIDKAIAQGVSKAKAPPAPPSNSPSSNGQVVWETFARQHRLPPEEKVEYERLYTKVYGGGPPPENLRQNPYALLENLRVFRSAELKSSAAKASQRKEARRASMPPPSSAGPASPPKLPKNADEMTLEEYETWEKSTGGP
jgi:hypothetical protein